MIQHHGTRLDGEISREGRGVIAAEHQGTLASLDEGIADSHAGRQPRGRLRDRSKKLEGAGPDGGGIARIDDGA
jgi:hypothetical protein